ncbi:mechanosensitive ion channel domain-containing protein [Halobellus ruber]|uniref:Mechanosensitive ion channel n=1 Tax=Halobellus ruber TaxID=2761102 RepID=A0A7J9SQ76_9EURY|nr:mechanosensitive ion channel domain-containing protein [Halobellus ruber]MBB6647871.1 mechanosensitive ion channel [Halobellus ruber]
MMVAVAEFLTETVARTINEFVDGLQTAAPRLLGGLVFLTIAYAAIRLLTGTLRRTLDSVYAEDQRLVADLGVTIASIFLWFGVALTLLKIFGMGEIAASLGTATGFVALGISYALSNMLADTVAGVYLLRDPDFNPGDEVKADPVTAIELRKTRFRNAEGETVVVANRDVEKKWTKLGTDAADTPE